MISHHQFKIEFRRSVVLFPKPPQESIVGVDGRLFKGFSLCVAQGRQVVPDRLLALFFGGFLLDLPGAAGFDPSNIILVPV